jgi:hypothetical protein
VAVEFLFVAHFCILSCVHGDSDRLENEHTGNMDQYRVTREMPLPYRIQDADEDEDDEMKSPVEDEATVEVTGSSKSPENRNDDGEAGNFLPN